MKIAKDFFNRIIASMLVILMIFMQVPWNAIAVDINEIGQVEEQVLLDNNTAENITEENENTEENPSEDTTVNEETEGTEYTTPDKTE